jgi:tRNA-Thr(GGU) m(6)t(6)A37 methyltransferase TsaA
VTPRTFDFRAIGVVRSPQKQRADAPRQAIVSQDLGSILLDGVEHPEDALAGLETFSHLWVVYVFHLNEPSHKPKVRPPRSDEKKGVFATRSPHRPNPIGLYVVELIRIDGREVFVKGLDILDGSPVLDLKPYLPYADSVAGANHGWLVAPRDPGPSFKVRFQPEVARALHFFSQRTGLELESAVTKLLETGPAPHAYRRIRRESDGSLELAYKSLRLSFRVSADEVEVFAIKSGYRPKQLHDGRAAEGEGLDELALHREYFAGLGSGA